MPSKQTERAMRAKLRTKAKASASAKAKAKAIAIAKAMSKVMIMKAKADAANVPVVDTADAVEMRVAETVPVVDVRMAETADAVVDAVEMPVVNAVEMRVAETVPVVDAVVMRMAETTGSVDVREAATAEAYDDFVRPLDFSERHYRYRAEIETKERVRQRLVTRFPKCQVREYKSSVSCDSEALMLIARLAGYALNCANGVYDASRLAPLRDFIDERLDMNPDVPSTAYTAISVSRHLPEAVFGLVQLLLSRGCSVPPEIGRVMLEWYGANTLAIARAPKSEGERRDLEFALRLERVLDPCFAAVRDVVAISPGVTFMRRDKVLKQVAKGLGCGSALRDLMLLGDLYRAGCDLDICDAELRSSFDVRDAGTWTETYAMVEPRLVEAALAASTGGLANAIGKFRDRKETIDEMMREIEA